MLVSIFFMYWARRRQRTGAVMSNMREFLYDAGYCLDRPESLDNEPY